MAEGSDRVTSVMFNSETLAVHLADGCILTVPLAWFPRLLEASSTSRRKWQVEGNAGHTVCWPEVDETLDVASLLRREARNGVADLRS